MVDNSLKTQIDERLKEILPLYLKGNAFIDRKVTDTPTEAYAVVPRKFVTANGLASARPNSSVASIGQPYYATDTFIPMTYSLEGWRNGVGSIVALNN